MKIWIIIPTYNEKENLADLVECISQSMSLNSAGSAFGGHDWHILIVDDNSPDGTGQIAEDLKHKYALEVLHRQGKLGLGSAYCDGFKYCLAKGADLIFEMDADFSHQPKDLPRMVQAIENGYDMAIGSRKVKGGKIIGWNWWRYFCSNGAMFFSRLVLGLKTHDVTAGFRCYTKKVLESIDLDKIKSNSYAFQEEMIYRVEKSSRAFGIKIKEIPVTFVDRQKGKSKLNKKDIWEFFIVMFKLRL